MVTKAEAARNLAEKHFAVEESIVRIFWLTRDAKPDEPAAEPIKLLEVNTATVPSGVMPLHFGPAPASGIPFPSVIVEVTPDEFRLIERRELPLPDDWWIYQELQRNGNTPE